MESGRGDRKDIDSGMLWDRLRNGEQESLEILFRRYFDSLYSYGYRIVSDSDRVRDAIQEVFYSLWKYKSNLNDVKSVRAYLFVSLKRELLNNKAADKRRDEINHEYIAEEFDPFFNYEKWLEILELQNEKKEQVKRVLKQLSPRQREAIYLRYFEGLSNKELSRVLGMRTQSVYNLVSGAIKSIRSQLEN